MSDESVLTVSQLTAEVSELLETGIGSVRVEGEISNFRRQSSGHLYFTLKDDASQVQAVQFRSDAGRLTFSPEDGQQVVASGRITVYAPRGQYQIRVQSLALRGQGNLQQRFEELKKRLRAEGLFDEARKRPLPTFPRRIGLVTSPTGAAIRDFLNVLGRRCPRLTVVTAGVRVQGERAAPEIADAISRLNREGNVDLIVITRGGGSLEDLWPFNEEEVARAIVTSGVPVLSGVGHEIDFTIADFAADLRAPTPSAAAELLSLSDQEWMDRLDRCQAVLRERVDSDLEARRLSLERFQDHYIFREPIRIVEQYQQRLDEIKERIGRGLQEGRQDARLGLREAEQAFLRMHPGKSLRQWKVLLKQAGSRLEALSPQATLDRGYAIVFDPKKKILRKVRAAEAAGDLSIRLSDGSFRARFEEKVKE
jgi:exodeoxyribonuclease VII large subunit